MMIRKRLLLASMAAAFAIAGGAQAANLEVSEPAGGTVEFAGELLDFVGTGDIRLGSFEVTFDDISVQTADYILTVTLSGGAVFYNNVTFDNFSSGSDCGIQSGGVAAAGTSEGVFTGGTTVPGGTCSDLTLAFEAALPQGESGKQNISFELRTAIGDNLLGRADVDYADFTVKSTTALIDGEDDGTVLFNVDPVYSEVTGPGAVGGSPSATGYRLGTVSLEDAALAKFVDSTYVIDPWTPFDSSANPSTAATGTFTVEASGGFGGIGSVFLAQDCSSAPVITLSGTGSTRSASLTNSNLDTLLADDHEICVSFTGTAIASSTFTGRLFVNFTNYGTIDTGAQDLARLRREGSSREVWNIPSNENLTVGDAARIRVYHKGGTAGAVLLNLRDQSGDVVCNDDFVATMEPGEAIVLDASDVKTACGVTDWNRRAYGEVVAEFDGLEVQALMRDRSGTLVNFSSVARDND